MNCNTFYQNNIDIIKKSLPALYHKIHEHPSDVLISKLLKSEKGDLTLQVSDGQKCIFIHSKKDPKAEAKRFILSHIDGSEQLVIIVGFGLGYHIESLLKRNPTSVVLIIEPGLSIFRETLNARDISGILLAHRVFLFHDETHIPYDEILSSYSLSQVKLLILRPYYELFAQRIANIKEQINSLLNKTEINLATLKRFDRLWTKNTFKNSHYFFKLPGVRKLANLLTGIPAAVICAGASFDEDVKTLFEMKEHVILIAVDTALKPLLKRGIIPDFVVTVDPQYINCFFMAHLENLLPPKYSLPVLIADPAVYPSILRSYPGIRIITSSVFSPGKIIEGFSGTKGLIAAGGSVAVAAFDVARIFGSDPIILLGLDLSYSGGKTHLDGSFVGEFILSRIHRLEPSANYYVTYLKNGNPVIINDKTGKRVFTDRRLLLYKKWFESQSGDSRSTVINAAHSGLSIEGFKNIPLMSLINDVNKSKINRKIIRKKLLDVLAEEKVQPHKIKAFKEYLDSLLHSISSMIGLSISGKILSKKLIDVHSTDSESAIKNKLEIIDTQILSFKEENRLLSMVMQSSINEVLRTHTVKEKGKVYENSLKLYTSIEEGLRFLKGLLEVSLKKLKKLL